MKPCGQVKWPFSLLKTSTFSLAAIEDISSLENNVSRVMMGNLTLSWLLNKKLGLTY